MNEQELTKQYVVLLAKHYESVNDIYRPRKHDNTNCDDLERCTNCHDCIRCVDCDDCELCTECATSVNCIKCRRCNDCENCVECFQCFNCKNVNNAILCVSLENKPKGYWLLNQKVPRGEFINALNALGLLADFFKKNKKTGRMIMDFFDEYVNSWKWRMVRVGHTRKSFCKLAGVSLESLSGYLNDTRVPGIKSFNKIENKLRRLETELKEEIEIPEYLRSLEK